MILHQKTENLINMVENIHNECIGVTIKDIKTNTNTLKDFTNQKICINNKIKLIRSTINRRKLYTNKNKGSDAVQCSHIIRTLISDVYKDYETLIQIHMRDKENNKDSLDYNSLFENREHILRLIANHIREFEFSDLKQTNPTLFTENNRNIIIEDILKLPDIMSIPDLTVTDGFEKQAINDKAIDKLLDNVLLGVVELKNLGLNMNSKVDESIIIIDELNIEVENENKQLIKTNTNLKKLLHSIRSPKKLFCDIILCIMLIGFIGTVLVLLLRVIKL
jgi:hypothetical protein